MSYADLSNKNEREGGKKWARLMWCKRFIFLKKIFLKKVYLFASAGLFLFLWIVIAFLCFMPLNRWKMGENGFYCCIIIFLMSIFNLREMLFFYVRARVCVCTCVYVCVCVCIIIILYVTTLNIVDG